MDNNLKAVTSSSENRMSNADQGYISVHEKMPLSPPGSQISPTKTRKINLPSLQRTLSTATRPICKESQLWSRKNAHLDTIVLRCKGVIEDCLLALTKSYLTESDIVKNVIGELEKVSLKTQLPRTMIALIGGTGTGKSTLLNALLDDKSVLPTSDDRACTSVVVEVEQNVESKFEADVQFLEKNYWFGELRALLDDLTSEDGSLRIRQPEYGSDMYVSYCKVKAVYGRLDTFESLSNIESINQWLGKTHHLACSDNEIETFQDQVESFIVAKKHCTNTQSLWPIVKHVRIKLPCSDVCGSGASLVDLPGIGDSNPARNNIAKEFLKECHSVWVINAMPRATHDVTSRDLLDHGLRRQFVMDGKMESIAFVCTMSDRFSQNNTFRTHQLDARCRDLKVQKYSMEMDQKQLQQHIKVFQDTDISFEKAQIWDLHENIARKNFTISKICAESRNEACVRRIKRLFMNIKRRYSLIRHSPNSEESETNTEEENEDSEEKDPEETDMEKNIKVFCCSSTEYQKLMGFNKTDGPPKVFEHAEDTQIPALKEYVHELTYARRQKGLEELVRSLGRCIFNFLRYLRHGGRLSTATSTGIEVLIGKELSCFKERIQPVLQTMNTRIGNLFREQIRPRVIQGAEHAKQEAISICDIWGLPVNTTQMLGEVRGLHWRSYRAVVQRKGVCTLPSSGFDVNFNQELADPIYNEMENDWNRVFNSQISQVVAETLQGIENETLLFIEHICEQINQLNTSEDLVKDIKKQLKLTVKGKMIDVQTFNVFHAIDNAENLSGLLSQMSHEVTSKQRQINRILPPYIQLKLDDVYTAAASQKGKGSTLNTKRCMREGIDRHRHTMFDEATGKLMRELACLQKEITNVLFAQCTDLEEDMRTAFESLWKCHAPSVAALYNVISSACDEVREIYADANLENKEEVRSTVEISPQTSHIPGAPDLLCSKSISQFFKHIPEDQITVQRSNPHNDVKTKSKKDQETISRWECGIQDTLRNGSSEEILKVLSTCPNAETSEVLLPFVHESETHRKIMMTVAELFQNKLSNQGYEVSIWPGYNPNKSEHVLLCMYKKEKPQVGRYFNMYIVYVNIDFFEESTATHI